ncbi:L,D-transpeptidase family protein [Streptomyces sp. 549]|uniref:L,D-transpeptidase family protein n=1 Tax=Streptomyces sp. 549 TaxID=3049076 RepID=UPI0024C3BEA8|nr:L,D-transpeptidase family protein [Streptomyces sp. 549]MDK1474660.1 L,D-transpeptidase family protein [Streptomyces sp. 549]
MGRLVLRRRAAVAPASLLVLLFAGCASPPPAGPAPPATASPSAAGGRSPQRTAGLTGVGERLAARIPASTRQVVLVRGQDTDSARAVAELWQRVDDGGAPRWWRAERWPAHNGRRGWTEHHREGDRRSPAGVFTLSDAGGLLPDPGARLPYTESAAFTTPPYWPKTHRHDFDHVIAVDYNRVRGTSPADPTRPEGRAAGGGIWLHLDHVSGTSGCVGLPKSAMRTLLTTLDPARHPVAVMGDRTFLRR